MASTDFLKSVRWTFCLAVILRAPQSESCARVVRIPKIPEFEMPQIRQPIEYPDVKIPNIPEFEMPQIRRPIEYPDVKIPEIQLPDTRPEGIEYPFAKPLIFDQPNFEPNEIGFPGKNSREFISRVKESKEIESPAKNSQEFDSLEEKDSEESEHHHAHHHAHEGSSEEHTTQFIIDAKEHNGRSPDHSSDELSGWKLVGVCFAGFFGLMIATVVIGVIFSTCQRRWKKKSTPQYTAFENTPQEEC